MPLNLKEGEESPSNSNPNSNLSLASQDPTPSSSTESSDYHPLVSQVEPDQESNLAFEQNWNSWLEGARKGTSFVETKRANETHIVKEHGTLVVTDISWETIGFWKENFIPVPDVDKATRRRRAGALRRHGFTSLSDRPALARFAAHSRRVFQAEFACFVLASTSKSQCVMLGDKNQAKGDQPTFKCNKFTQSLVNPSEPFVIRDAHNDARITTDPLLQERSNQFPSKARFFASVPLFLSLPGEDGDQEAVGRLVIISTLPRPHWTDDDTKLLSEISLMATESLERENQMARSKRVSLMQRATATLARSTEEPHQLGGSHSCGESTNPSVQTSDGFDYCPKRVQLACSQVQKAVGASCVYVLDTSTFKFNASKSSTSSGSPRASFYPQSPWISSPLTPPAELASSDGSDSSPSIKRSKSRPHFRSISSQFSQNNQTPTSEDGEICSIPESGPVFVASQQSTRAPKTFGLHQRKALASWLGNWKKEGRLQRPATYFNLTDSDTSDDTDEEPFGMSRNPLGPLLLDPETVQYSAMPVFGLDGQPLFVLISTFSERAIIEEECSLFIESSAMIIRASIMRQAVLKADTQAHLFIQSIQHELRTPLNAVLGISDFMRASLNGDLETDERIDLGDDSVLISLLEAIRLAGTNLNTILDDVLDFGQSSGISSSSSIADRRVEDVDLNQLIEDVAGDELEHLHLTNRVDADVSELVHASTLGSARYPELVIKMNALLENNRWRVDRTSLQKILKKLISNALRFTSSGFVEVSCNPTQGSSQPEGESLICFTIKDTGSGMTKEFIETKYLRPFSKGNSFSQGSGLGASVAAALSERMNGKILVRSVVGEGTEIDVLVPLLNLGTFQSPPQQPYRVASAHFVGFGSIGSQKVRELIQEELEDHDVKIVEEVGEADSLVISEDQLTQSLGERLKGLKDSARVIVVTGNLIARSTSMLPSDCGSVLSNKPIRFLKPPFGSSLLKSLNEFLQEESPFRLLQPRIRRQGMSSSSEPPTKSNEQEEHDAPAPIKEKVDGSKAAVAEEQPSEISLQPQVSTEDHEFRVLLVEDNPINMKLLSTICDRMKIKTEKAEDGLQAIQKFISFKPSLVLLDISIPIHDGFEVCQMMRAHKLDHEPRIVAVTALSSQTDKNRGMDLGMNDWRQKPVSMKGLRTDLAGWRSLWEAAHPPPPQA